MEPDVNPDSPKALVFDWHVELQRERWPNVPLPDDAAPTEHETPSSFLAWLVTAALPHDQGRIASNEVIDAISNASNKLRDCRLQIFMNGIEMDADAFLAGVRRTMDWNVGIEAQKLLKELCDWEDIEHILDDTRRELKDRLRKTGLELPDEEYW